MSEERRVLTLVAKAPDPNLLGDAVDYAAQMARWAAYYGFTEIDVQLMEPDHAAR